METLKNTIKELSRKEMQQIFGGKIIRKYYYNKEGKLCYKDVYVAD